MKGDRPIPDRQSTPQEPPPPLRRPTREDYARGGVIPGAGATSERYIAFDRHVSPEHRRRFLEEEFARQTCSHEDAAPVESIVDGELLAWLCPDCDTQLPADRRAWADPYRRPLNPAPNH
ncbi:hypothetical protein FHX37_0482 [Haloactinospora alba]|uniref:Uncharacterized protein n=1 Tax=Haloactinospora alba TaxID=405555 RepID=A0A543NFQ9_9ACTN|nr:hypothetical protein [Haloactinospora alba]TQN30600.1 hypothetical protein FHX37_0482 [Haloactinospora alba]